ncbi:16S rRNA (adenine(1518)-N(6)/adenine(1519)-N(6))-dimethyltransferase RsmA [Methanobacterium congolense]|uniref:Probable ribosomal RNA small subunit methyltransferase A n=1 Tax=Methanobacterium congolense TaxID=118062 RepID=A0A1D3L536_9EURY|nr:16S rRNA (adenine(1518)-N(6)/adenine(1519)-N(6))-dimethyltransferase RsmA [Methanobacterium congolense]SCG86754.1 putative ribosomal RNA small subunit methyltransferase A [Methanobacterium congolense]
MNLRSQTINVLKSNNIRLDKRKGQNYLINPGILSRIVKSAELSTEDTVLEIGAGIGTLTLPLAERAKKVVAVEQDIKIADVLKKRLDDLDIHNVEVIVGDATQIDFPEFNKVVSNLPYKISSPITFKLLEHDFESAVLMYQKEFAERMVAEPGNKNYSRLSVMMHFGAKVTMLFDVPPSAFIPQPKVSSAVIKLTPDKREGACDEDTFKKTSRALFQHKRKKVANALLDSFHEIQVTDKKTAKKIVSSLDPNIISERAVNLNPEEILKISRDIRSLLERNRN